MCRDQLIIYIKMGVIQAGKGLGGHGTYALIRDANTPDFPTIASVEERAVRGETAFRAGEWIVDEK